MTSSAISPKSRWIIFQLLALSFSLLVVGCSKKDSTQPVTVKSLSIGIQDNTSAATVLLAKELGFFEENGLDVTIKRYPTGKLAFQAMLDGEVDFSTASEVVIASHAFERKDFTVVASIATVRNSAWIVARKDRGISSAADLKGKTVGTQKNSAVHFFLSRFLLWNGIAKDVETVFMPAAELPQAIADGKIDAFSMRNPIASKAMEMLGENGVELFEPDAYRQFFVLAVNKSFADADQTAVKSVLKTFCEVGRRSVAGGEETIALAGQALGEGRTNEARADWGRHEFGVQLTQELLSMLETEAKWMINERGLKQEVPNYLQVLDSSHLREVSPATCTIIDKN